MNCTRCGKRLTRKTARQINGVAMCAPCMFGQSPGDSDAMLGTKPAGLSPEGVAARAAESGIAQPTPSENTNGK